MNKNITGFAIMILLFSNAIHAQDNWNNQNPATKPQSSGGHAMSFIGGDKIIAFGPGGTNETWVYDLTDNNWTLQNPATTPSARFF